MVLLNEYIRNIVKKLIAKYKTTSPVELAECLGITVLYNPLGSVWGMYKYIKKNKLILINSSLSEQEQKYVLAHELGHAVLHTKSSCFCYGLNVNTYKKEYEANIFSAELLIKCDEKDNTINGFSIDQLARYYNVPVGLINLKFNIN